MILTGEAALSSCIGRCIIEAREDDNDTVFVFDDGAKLTMSIFIDSRKDDVWLDVTAEILEKGASLHYTDEQLDALGFPDPRPEGMAI